MCHVQASYTQAAYTHAPNMRLLPIAQIISTICVRKEHAWALMKPYQLVKRNCGWKSETLLPKPQIKMGQNLNLNQRCLGQITSQSKHTFYTPIMYDIARWQDGVHSGVDVVDGAATNVRRERPRPFLQRKDQQHLLDVADAVLKDRTGWVGWWPAEQVRHHTWGEVGL